MGKVLDLQNFELLQQLQTFKFSMCLSFHIRQRFKTSNHCLQFKSYSFLFIFPLNLFFPIPSHSIQFNFIQFICSIFFRTIFESLFLHFFLLYLTLSSFSLSQPQTSEDDNSNTTMHYFAQIKLPLILKLKLN